MAQLKEEETADEIVRETRRTKEVLAKSMDFDIGRILADARQKQKESGREVLSPPDRRDA